MLFPAQIACYLNVNYVIDFCHLSNFFLLITVVAGIACQDIKLTHVLKNIGKINSLNVSIWSNSMGRFITATCYLVKLRFVCSYSLVFFKK